MADSSYSRPDHWTLKAKKEGYPARSVYKLQEIDAKFGLIKPGMKILDVGAAPGSWSLWILRRLAGKGFLAAVDLQPLKLQNTPDNFFSMQGDITESAVREKLSEYGPFNIVVSDAAPSTSGSRFVDQMQSVAIVEAVIECGLSVLKPSGAIVAKIFQGGSEREIMDTLKRRFTGVRTFKPETCRTESFETYLIATGYHPE